MKDFLFKLNMMKNHNQIIRLEQKNKENTDKTQKLVESYKKIVSDYQEKNQSEIKIMSEKIDKIEEENSTLRIQCKFYKDCLDNIPNFILVIFIGKNKKLLSKWEKIYERY